MDRLAILSASLARVVRDGTAQDLDMQDVVRDDVLLLGVDDQVPADASIIDGDGLEIDESLLTGESNPVSKGPGSEALSGSSVVAGGGRARVVRVGAGSFASNITAEANFLCLGLPACVQCRSFPAPPTGHLVTPPGLSALQQEKGAQ